MLCGKPSAAPCQQRVRGEFVLIANAMYRTLLARVAQRFSDVCTHCKRNVPHVARNVWLSGFQMFVLIEIVIN